MFKPFVENIEKFSSRYHKYIKSPIQVNNSDLKLGIIFEFIKFIKIKEKIENSNETSHTLKHLLLKCQSTIQELQGELEKSREEKTIFLDQIKNLKHQQFELEGKIKEEEIEKEKIQGLIKIIVNAFNYFCILLRGA